MYVPYSHTVQNFDKGHLCYYVKRVLYKIYYRNDDHFESYKLSYKMLFYAFLVWLCLHVDMHIRICTCIHTYITQCMHNIITVQIYDGKNNIDEFDKFSAICQYFPYQIFL